MVVVMLDDVPFAPSKPDNVACSLHVVGVTASDGELLAGAAVVALTVTPPK